MQFPVLRPRGPPGCPAPLRGLLGRKGVAHLVSRQPRGRPGEPGPLLGDQGSRPAPEPERGRGTDRRGGRPRWPTVSELAEAETLLALPVAPCGGRPWQLPRWWRSEEHTSELQSLRHLVCRSLLEKKKNQQSPLDERRNYYTYSFETETSPHE